MTLRLKRQFLMIVCGVAGMALLSATLGYGEAEEAPAAATEAKTPAPDAKASDAKASDAKKSRAKPRGRLPVYYGKVVEAEQRERIYEIQRSYAEQMEPLRQQLAQLDEQLRAEVREVLSDEQRQKVDQLVAAARTRREAAKAKREAARSAKSERAADESAAGE